jgi:4-amino-4-deoxy-L-arabinose transferase-like glycosyltransferase
MYFEAVLLGLLGFLFYILLKRYGEVLAIIAGATIAAHPILGDHTFDIGTETLFTFFLGVVFALCVRIMRDPETKWYWYALLGLAAGYQTLVRMQFVLFIPFIAFCYFVYLYFLRRNLLSWITIRNSLTTVAIAALIPISFATYIYQHTGIFAVTQGRDNEMLYYRAVRAQLSYGEITQYARDWLWRSISGGVNTQFLTDNELKKLGYEYGLKATTSEAIAQIRAENIQTILSRPGHYLYGNLVEIMKLAYIEHDYADSFPRVFRPILYGVMYVFFLFGAYHFFRTKGNWDIRSLQILSVLFIFYNTVTLSFLNVVPRFNTPYLPLFILVGFLGIVLFLRKSKNQ